MKMMVTMKTDVGGGGWMGVIRYLSNLRELSEASPRRI